MLSSLAAAALGCHPQRGVRESGLAFLGYLAALAAGGGENGAGMRIALFIQKEYYPVVIVCAAISAAIGLFSMYLNGAEGLSLKEKQDEGEGESKEI